jgi:copper chaperone CopZ
MRTLSALFLSFALVFGISACGQGQTRTEFKEAKIKVFFHCVNGKALIESELVKEAGVHQVLADLETKVVTISYNPAVTDQQKLVAAIEKIGYKTEFTPEDKTINKACTHENPGGPEQH